jgi:predicted HTH transcriptional regulator
MIWGIKDNEIVGTAFDYRSLVQKEHLKDYLVKQLDPSVELIFSEVMIGSNRTVVLRISASKLIPTSFNKERFIIIDSSKVNLLSFPEIEISLFHILSDHPSIIKIESSLNDLSFSSLLNHYNQRNIQIDKDDFCKQLYLQTTYGKFNLLAYLLSDNNELSIKVSLFDETDESVLFYSKEFGRKCLIDSMLDAEDYLEYLNEVHSSFPNKQERVDTELFDIASVKEVWRNACEHNTWYRMIPPSINIYRNRVEIISIGGIPPRLTEKEFFDGIRGNVNPELETIFKQLGLVKQIGYGVQTVTSKHGIEAYSFSPDFIKVIIKFRFMRTKQVDMSLPINRLTLNRKIIVSFLKEYREIKRSEVESILKISKTSSLRILQDMSNLGIICRNGTSIASQYVIAPEWQ